MVDDRPESQAYPLKFAVNAAPETQQELDSDLELAAGVLAGDQNARAAFLCLYADRVRSYVSQRIPSGEDQLNLVSDNILLKASASLAAWQRNPPFTAWLDRFVELECDRRLVDAAIKAAEKGDNSRIGALALQYGGAIRAVVGRQTIPERDREDVVFNVVMAVSKNLHRWTPDRPLKYWILAIARNKCAEYFRPESVRNEVLEDSEEAVHAMRTAAGNSYDAPDIGTRFDENDFVRDVSSMLSPRERDIIALWYWEELNSVEIALKLGMLTADENRENGEERRKAVNLVDQTKKRALEKLRKKLRDKWV